jgi:glycerol-3-phosphate dehydrogenase (NAD(P)+)
MKISVLGAGGWGTTLAILLFHNGHDVTLWEYNRSYAKKLERSRENKILLRVLKFLKK